MSDFTKFLWQLNGWMYGIFAIGVIIFLITAWVRYGGKAGTRYAAERMLRKDGGISNKTRGMAGEELTYRYLKENVFDKDVIFRNVLVRRSDGKKLTQIDMLAVGQKGVYVIENKSMTGRIYIYGKSQTMTEYFEGGKKSKPFRNPIEQNRFHVEQLKNRLDIAGVDVSDMPFYSVIVLGDACQIMKKVDVPNDTVIANRQDIKNELAKVVGGSSKAVDERKRAFLCESIRKTQANMGTKKEHARQYKKT